MAKYKVTSPDGQQYVITAPDDATDEQVTAYAKANFTKADPIREAINKSPTAGLMDAAVALGSGAVAGPVSGIAGLLQGAKNVVSPGMSPGDRVKQVQGALSYEPQTTIGEGITKAISYPFVKLAELGDWAGGKTASATGSPAIGAAANTSLQAIPLLLGRIAPASEGAAALTKRNALREAHAGYDAGITKAKEAGYVLPPTQANPSLFNQLVEGIAGKIKTAQTASLKNQEVTNGLVRKGLGIAEDAPLNAGTLAQVRKSAGQSYERIRDSGRVTTDPLFVQNLDAIAEPYLRASKDFPDSARMDIIDAVKAAKRDSFDASSAVDQIRILRDKADTAYGGRDKSLGRAYKGIADALEEQLGRHLEASGVSAQVLNDFRQAREVIAKSYTVQKHLGADGNVDAAGLARELKRKPLSGDIRTAAEFGQQFPKAAQRPERVGGVPMSMLDLGIGGGAMAMLHSPYAAAAAATRPLVRNALLSGPFQRNFVTPPSYGPSMLSNLRTTAGRIQNQPLVPLSEIAEGQR